MTIPPDLDEARRFLELLDDPGARFGFRTFADDKTTGRPDLIVNRYGRFDDVADELRRLNERGAGVFVTVNALDGRGYSEENVAGVRALFVDLDEDGPAALAAVLDAAPTPTAVVESSPEKYHVYWRPATPIPVARFRDLQTALIERFESDPKVKDPPRVMRLPGFVHQKVADLPFRTRVVSASPEARLDTSGWTVAPRRRTSGPPPVAERLGAGERNAGLTSIAGTMRRRGMSVAAIEAALLAENRDRCSPPLPEDEVRVIARSIARKAPSSSPGDFVRDGKGNVVANDQDNVRLAIARLDAALSYDEFADRLLVQRGDGGSPELLDDDHVARLWLDVDATFAFRPAETFFRTVVVDTARRNAFHPVKAYLDSLTWDGRRRTHRWLVDYLGAEDSAYTRAVGQLLLVAAVRRIRTPGSKFDEMPVLEGPQGGGKSTALEGLVPDATWFTDDLPLNSDSKEVIERTTGRWIVEAAELAGARRTDVERLKSFLSRRTDKARLAYGRLTTERPRHFVVVGTTNDAAYLKDSTGNRRFWPVKVGAELDVEGLKRDRDQLWAEAARLEADGASTRLDRRLWARAAAEQEARRLEDPWEEVIVAAFGDRRGRIRSDAVWTLLGVDVGRRSPHDSQRFNIAMARAGFDRRRVQVGGTRSYWYVRGADDDPSIPAGERAAAVLALPELTVDVDSAGCASVSGPDDTIPF